MLYSTNTLEACVYASDHRDVINICTNGPLSTKGDKDAFRSDRTGDMHALNANSAAKTRVLAIASTLVVVSDDDGSPLITRCNLSHRLSLSSRRNSAVPRNHETRLADTQVITLRQVSSL